MCPILFDFSIIPPYFRLRDGHIQSTLNNIGGFAIWIIMITAHDGYAPGSGC